MADSHESSKKKKTLEWCGQTEKLLNKNKSEVKS